MTIFMMILLGVVLYLVVGAVVVVVAMRFFGEENIKEKDAGRGVLLWPGVLLAFMWDMVMDNFDKVQSRIGFEIKKIGRKK